MIYYQLMFLICPQREDVEKWNIVLIAAMKIRREYVEAAVWETIKSIYFAVGAEKDLVITKENAPDAEQELNRVLW